MSDLEEMMNIGPAMKRNLIAVGITNKQELINIGPSSAYTKMKEKGLNVCAMTLYAMEGALLDKNAIDIARMMKEK